MHARRQADGPGDLHPPGDPLAHVRLEPADRARTERHGPREDAVNPSQRPSLAAQILLQPPDDVGDEIVKPPSDPVAHLPHFRKPAAELWINLPRFTA